MTRISFSEDAHTRSRRRGGRKRRESAKRESVVDGKRRRLSNQFPGAAQRERRRGSVAAGACRGDFDARGERLYMDRSTGEDMIHRG